MERILLMPAKLTHVFTYCHDFVISKENCEKSFFSTLGNYYPIQKKVVPFIYLIAKKLLFNSKNLCGFTLLK
jgi:hypothetical protein